MKFTVFLPLFALAVCAQSRLEFDAASVKPNNSGSGSWTFNSDDGRLSVVNASLKVCIRFAYDVKDYQIHGPGWLDSYHYDITAVTPRRASDPEIMQMLQALLADRFKLAVHHETETLPVFRLVGAKGGSKLHPVDAHEERDNLHNGELDAHGIAMGQLAEILARRLDRPVIDETGLQGRFDLNLKWAPDNEPESDRPSLFTAMQEQLGLKLEAGKGPVDILVIDHAEQPDEN